MGCFLHECVSVCCSYMDLMSNKRNIRFICASETEVCLFVQRWIISSSLLTRWDNTQQICPDIAVTVFTPQFRYFNTHTHISQF